MKTCSRAVLIALTVSFGLELQQSRAQFPMSIGPYAQNFDVLATSGTANSWVNNNTLPGWYAARNGTNALSYSAGDGSRNAGDLWSYGVAGVSNVADRALGSVASGTATPVVFGLRFTNDTAATFTNLVITYAGDQCCFDDRVGEFSHLGFCITDHAGGCGAIGWQRGHEPSIDREHLPLWSFCRAKAGDFLSLVGCK